MPGNTETEGQRVFISYSRADGNRVEGLALLLEALGHRVFLDRRTIKPGVRWEAKLQDGLEEAEVLLVYWTKRAAQSDWVRREYEHFHAHSPERMLVPILGDETPLTAVLERLRKAGIELDESKLKKVFRLFAPVGLLGLLATPLMALKDIGAGSLEAAANLSSAQAALVGAAAVSGALAVGVTDRPVEAPSVVPAAQDTATGTLSVTSVLARGGEPVNTEWRVYSAPNELGDRREISYGGTMRNARFTLPAGSYLVRAWLGDATEAQEVVVRAGEVTLEELLLSPSGP